MPAPPVPRPPASRRPRPALSAGRHERPRRTRLELEELSQPRRPLDHSRTSFPILPLRDTVLFPNSFMPLAVARESSVRLIDEAISGGKLIGVFTQRDASVEEPQQGDLYPVGTASHIHKMFKLPDGSLRLIVQGLARLHARRGHRAAPVPARARQPARRRPAPTRDRLEIDALLRNIKTNFQQVVSLSPLLSDDLQTLAVEHHRARPARRLHRVEPDDHQHAGQAGGARDARRARAAWTRSTGS